MAGGFADWHQAYRRRQPGYDSPSGGALTSPVSTTAVHTPPSTRSISDRYNWESISAAGSGHMCSALVRHPEQRVVDSSTRPRSAQKISPALMSPMMRSVAEPTRSHARVMSGERELLIQTEDDVAEERNRRVEIKLR
jgi:hypothetical protein